MNRCYKYYHQNHIGSTALLTDNIGEKFQSYLYMPYGETWVVENGLNAINDENGDGIADDVNHLFTGQEYDKETGLYYYNARYYDPHLGMFMRPDPAMDGLNHYAYANCNPVMYNDPTGMYDSAAATSHAASYGVSYGNDTSASAGYSASYVSYMTSVHAASYGVNYNSTATFRPVDNSIETIRTRQKEIKEYWSWINKFITREDLKKFPKGTVLHIGYIKPSLLSNLMKKGVDVADMSVYDPRNPFIRHTVILIKDLRGRIISYSFGPGGSGLTCKTLLGFNTGKISKNVSIERLLKGHFVYYEKVNGKNIKKRIPVYTKDTKPFIMEYFNYQTITQQRSIFNYLNKQHNSPTGYHAIFRNCQIWSWKAYNIIKFYSE